MSPKSGRTGAVRRRRVTFVSMMVAAVLVPVAIAYACNPQAHVSLDKTSYQPGGAISIHGSYFVGNASVTVSGPTGSVGVTTSPGGGFATSLQAPTSPGSYTITATRPTGGFAAASFSVAAPAPVAPQPSSSGGSTPSAGTTNAPGFKTPGVSKSQAPASAESRNPPSSGSGGGGSTSSGGNVAGSTVTSSPTGQQVFSSAPAQATTGRSFSSTASGAGRASRSATVAPQAALSDLFSNYQPGSTPSLMGAVSGAPAGGAGSGLGLGIGLLAFGLLALVAGLTATEVRRRRPA